MPAAPFILPTTSFKAISFTLMPFIFVMTSFGFNPAFSAGESLNGLITVSLLSIRSMEMPMPSY